MNWTAVPYTCRLPRPIVTAHGEYRDRSGFLLLARGEDGAIGLGDVAPLPGFSRESLDQAQSQWEMIRHEVSRWVAPESSRELADLSPELERLTADVPSLRYAVELALADLAARRAAMEMARWLSGAASPDIEVNFLLSGDDPAVLAEQARAAFANGFRTFKIKVAIRPVALDVERVKAVRDAVPTANLRIDANEGWSEGQIAEAFPMLRELKLEFVEQPLPAGNAELARRYANEYGIPLALDEEIDSIAGVQRLIANGLCDGIVLKPMTGGGLMGNLALAILAHQSGVKVIFTSTWESDVGLAGTLHLACASGSAAAPCGLSTAGMIADGLVAPPYKISHGRLSVAGRNGLGLQVSR